MLSVAPSLRALTGEFHQHVRTPKLLLIGNPLPASPEFPPLPNAGKEVQAVAEHFPRAGQTVLTGAAAVPACYAKSAPASFSTIHFTAHATANRESPLNSAIILSRQGEQYMLYAREVAGVPLSADLVTVSACRSAGSKAYSGEGLMGFTWAFLQAGARHVIAGLWDVDDAASVPIMERLYAEIAAGQPPARALRAAKLDLIRSGGRNRLPYFWGALEVFTRGL
jgi:CHAT domain-containing protein